ncbi:MAG TPA: DUF4836 family protein [Flavisolibacter sp.]|nr:DUF4836 family protein [Flavisolibacter sp.]
MKRTPILTTLAAVLLLASCKNENKSDLAIPKDAAVVFHIDPNSLSSKLSWDDIKKTEWFKDAYAENKDSFAKKMMDNPEASGIDLGKDMAFFVKKRGKGGYTVFEGGVKDEKAFAAMLTKAQASAKQEKDGDWNVAKTSGGVTIWNGSKFAVINDAPMTGMNPMGGDMGDVTRFTADSLKIFATQLMAGKEESLFEDERFSDIMKEKADMHFWMNSSELYSDVAGLMSMMKAGALMQDNAMGGTINFEDGKITSRMKQFYGKELQKAMANWKFKDIDAAVLDRIPSQNVIGVFAMNMDPAGLKEFVKALGFDGMVNMMLSKQNLTLDELVGATKGQFVMALTDLQMKDTLKSYGVDDSGQVATYPSTEPDMTFLFAADVAQKQTFDKLLNLAKEESPTMPFTYQLNNDWFVAGNKADAVNAFAAGNASTKHAFTDKLKGTYAGFYLDIQRLLKTNFTKEPMGQSMLSEAAAVWQDVVMTSGEYKNGVATAEITINMVDKKTNSLKQMNQFIEKLNATKKANKVAMDEPMMNEDTMAPAVGESPHE